MEMQGCDLCTPNFQGIELKWKASNGYITKIIKSLWNVRLLAFYDCEGENDIDRKKTKSIRDP